MRQLAASSIESRLSGAVFQARRAGCVITRRAATLVLLVVLVVLDAGRAATSDPVAPAQGVRSDRPRLVDDPAAGMRDRRTPPRPSSAAGLDLGPSVMRSAIAEADRDGTPKRTTAVFGSPGTPAVKQQARIDRRFEDATIESCGGVDTFKFDPPKIGPIVVGGLLSIPFLIHAMATGRCKLPGR